MAFEFTVRAGEEITLDEAIGQAIGAASMCWSVVPFGVFESDRASEILDALKAVIDRERPKV
jgi:hypothetical protein